MKGQIYRALYTERRASTRAGAAERPAVSSAAEGETALLYRIYNNSRQQQPPAAARAPQ